ncbi:UNVERIFIED_CONTAM: Kolavenyl diphosphate synthase TPS5, chloroplastic [Sesamum radiatum]|uniref:Kolavenyl diphosphate synthase TPS5, chloroplastic n=1 Tax=Sesamum radiatum TaxID=300843 RepID=A0AAW2UTP5_SESRA
MAFASHKAASLLRSPPSCSGHLAPLHVLGRSSLPLIATGGVFTRRSSSVTSTSLLRCNAISEGNRNYTKRDGDDHKMSEKIGKLVESIRSMLHCMDDGEISVSPYDTAWVALVEDIGHGETPQFPSALDWISSNQLEDGSWGDRKTFSAYDRIINTLACVVALRFWKLHPHKCNKGISFLKDNFHKLEDENEEHMTIGFEVALPTLMEIAKKLGFDISNDFSGLQRIYARRDLKLTRIPWDTMHKVPTTLLYSLEAMSGLDWQKLLKLQSTNGSFLGSPSSTAFALQQTKDENCLKYLLKLVQKFNGGVPNVHPVDLFEHLWVVDRLQRLGISRYFQPEIDEYIDYVSRYWTSRGICCQRNSEVQDIDDTAMGFRLLRLHGYEVSADVFKHFENGGEFFCFMGQSDQPVTGMYNLYRASQVMFPEEEILADARKFSAKFLQEKRANTKILDKWIIAKDLPGEVGYALDVPWYASLPRLETRFYLEQYGGEEDAWIGKTLYRMPYVNNNDYLELAKLDYNHCQALHLHEWEIIQEWCRNSYLGEFGLSERSLRQAYYIAAASIYEPEKSGERLAWVKTAVLVETIVSHFNRQQLSRERKQAFVNEFRHGSIVRDSNGGRIGGILIRTVSQLSFDAQSVHDKDIYQELNHAVTPTLSFMLFLENPQLQLNMAVDEDCISIGLVIIHARVKA